MLLITYTTFVCITHDRMLNKGTKLNNKGVDIKNPDDAQPQVVLISQLYT